MATIDELMKGKVPGSVKIYRRHGNSYAVPYCRTSTGKWVGLDEDNNHWHWNVEDPGDWRVYKEPKKKVTMWQWARPSGLDSTNGFYPEGGIDSYTKKLEYTATEFEVGDD